jgi:FkbM family methyltransferase
MFARVLKLVIPRAVRHPVHEWVTNQVSKCFPLSQLYLWLLFGKSLEGIKVVDKKNVLYRCSGHNIIAPRNAAHIFKEIFLDEVYEKRFKPSGTVIDIGAFVGMFSIKASLTAKEVIAIEPCPEMYEMLRTNCSNILNIRLVNKAISNKHCVVRLYLARSAYGNSITNKTKTFVAIEAITLDDLVHGPVNFIKIDTEGSELDILEGAPRTLSYPGTKLAIAAYHCLANGEPELPHIVSYLENRGYDVYTENNYVYAEKQ